MRGDLRSPARRPPRARRPAAIGPSARLDADDPVAVADEPGHRRVLDDVDAALRSRPAAYAHATRSWRAVAPSTWCERAQDRVAAAAGQVELRDELLELGRRDHARSSRRRPGSSRQRARSVRIAISVWASQTMPLVWWRIAAPVSSSRRLVQLEGVLVEADRLGDAVVGADDRRVPAGVARGDVVGLEDRDVRDAVAGREVVGGRQAVAAAADDDDVVGRLRLVASGSAGSVSVYSLIGSHPSRVASSSRVGGRASAGAHRPSSGSQSLAGTPAIEPWARAGARSAAASRRVRAAIVGRRRATRRRSPPRPRRSRARRRRRRRSRRWRRPRPGRSAGP